MSHRLILILGGARSGKSSFAIKFAGEKAGKKFYLATAEPLDNEMKERIERHKKERPSSWETIEETKDIPQTLRNLRSKCDVVILDCVTLWLSNLLHEGHDESEILKITEELLSVVKENDYLLVAVSNEVGLGIVPDNGLARRFRDIAGRVNQEIASAADEVYFLLSGIPKRIKES